MRNLHRYLVLYGAASLGAFAATLLRITLNARLGNAVPFVTYEILVILLAWFRGFWPAAFVTALSAWLGYRYVLAPDSLGLLTAGRTERASVIAFVLFSLTISFLLDFQRRTLERARAAERAQASAVAELKQSNEELKRANRDLELFAYSASHDLQEPLRSISVAAQVMERNLPQRPPDRELIRQVILAAERMEALIQDVLAYVNAATTDADPPVPVDANLVFTDVVNRLQGSIMAEGATVTAGELPVVVCHPGRLAQVLQNLISNAIKYRGSDPPCVRVEARKMNHSWIFSVSDNGIGIEEQFSAKIFGLFKRLHTQDQYRGSGMGLAICQRIVEQYGGRIWLERSELGRGSTFCFSIPIR